MAMDVRYLRISMDKGARKAGNDAKASMAALNSSLTGQRRECRAVEARTDATDVVEFVDHDVSASKGRPRAEYRKLMALVETGTVGRVYVLHLSRIWRNRAERAKGIEVFRKHGVSLVCAKGPTFDLTTATGRSMAAILGEIDTMESELKGERVQAWHETRAEQGLHPGGPAPYGYRYQPTGRLRTDGRPEHKLVKTAEAKKVADWFRRALAGESLWSISRSAGTTPATMRQRFRNGTYAGIRELNGVEYEMKQPDGKDFSTVVSVETWRAAKAMVDGRRIGSTRARTLMAGVAVCDQCDVTVLSGADANRGRPSRRVYKCMTTGCYRQWRAEWLEGSVEDLVRERLSRPSAAGLVARTDAAPESQELLDEAAGIRARLRGLATDSVLKGVDVSEAVAAAKARLGEIERLTSPETDEVLVPLVKSKSPVKMYNSLSVRQRQAVIRRLMDVRLLAPPRGRWPHHDDEERQRAWYLEACIRIASPG